MNATIILLALLALLIAVAVALALRPQRQSTIGQLAGLWQRWDSIFGGGR